MNKVQVKLIEEIMDHEEKLTEWEAKFVDDIYNRDPDTLTTNQNHKLNQIHNRVVFQ